MSITTLLQDLRLRGITIARVGEGLKVQAPQGAMTPELRDRLVAHKEAMLRWLQESAPDEEAPLPVCVPDPERRYEPFPLSDLQYGFYMADDPYMEFHVRPHYYMEKDLPGLDVERYEAAWNRALERHRGEIVTVRADGRLATVRDPEPLRCTVADLRGRAPEEVRAALAEVRAGMMRSELPLDRWPWVDLRVTLWTEEGRERARIHYNHNNFFSDGFGTTRLLQEIDEYYRDPSAERPPLTLSFRDAALALDDLARSPAGRAAQRYWEERLDALPGPPALPVRANLDRRCRSRLERREGFVPAAAWAAFKARAAHHGLTPSNAVFCAYAEVLAAWGNSRHFVLSNMMTRRLAIHPEIREIVGNFASLYPLEVDLRGDRTFVERARDLQEQVIRDARHLQWGGMPVMQALNRRRGSLGTAAIPFVVGSGLFMEGFERSDFSCLETSQVMLDHQFWELGDGTFYYVWDLLEAFFPAGMVDDMWEAYRGLVERLAAEPALWEARVLHLTPAAMLEARRAVTPPHRPVPARTLDGFLDDAARATPDAPALLACGAALGYRELDAAANSLARALQDLTVVRGRTVAIVAGRGPALVQAAYAVLKAGAAYVPLDPALPADRRAYVLADCEAAAVLAEERHARALEWPAGLPVLAIEDAASSWAAHPLEEEAPVDPSELAYVIYTSGSTGRPKGVMIEHSGAVNTIVDVNERFGVGPADRVFGVSSFGFDLSVYDLFGTAAAGAALVYPDPEQSLNPSHWLDVVQEEGVTVWSSAPPLALLLVETAEARGATLPALRLVMMSGDWIPVDLPDRIRRVAPNAHVVSLGGATEASIWSICYPIGEVDLAWPSIPYGYPMQNQPWHVLDEWGRPAPDWTAGDLYIGGDGLARGYRNDPEKTAAAFVRHPATGERIYRTGDVGRYLPGGLIEFLGRRDSQVKVQGHRIELGEIESVLAADPAVSAAVAAVQKSAAGAAQLAAYVVPAPGAAPDTGELRAALAAKLPEYMVPRAVRVLDRLPLSTNGKVDRKALPPLDEQPAAARAAEAREPADEVERRLLALWREVLKQESLSVVDDFFEAGGQSFEAVRIIGAVREAFGVSLSLGAVWQERTVERVAARIREGDAHAHAGPLVELRAGGTHAPLFLVHPAGGHVMCYRGLAALLDRPVRAFQAPGVDGREAPLDTIPALAEAYVARLEEAQPDGPVRLGGWSSGALIAFEMAAQLERRGRTVAGVAMIDCPAPHPGPPVDGAVLLAWFLEDLALDLPVPELVASVDAAALDARAQLEQVARTLRASGRELGLDLDQLAAIYRVFLGIVRGSRHYEGARVSADLLLVRAADGVVSEFAGHPSAHIPDWGWRAFTTGTVRSERFPGTHYTLLSDATVAGLAGTIEGWLLARETEPAIA